jgi:hypothetical protein
MRFSDSAIDRGSAIWLPDGDFVKNKKFSEQVGVGMIPRAEVGLIVAALGLQLQLISQESYAVIVFMAMLSTIVTPPFLRLAFGSQNHALAQAHVHTHKPLLRRISNAVIGLVVCASISGMAVVLFRDRPGVHFFP